MSTHTLRAERNGYLMRWCSKHEDFEPNVLYASEEGTTHWQRLVKARSVSITTDNHEISSWSGTHTVYIPRCCTYRFQFEPYEHARQPAGNGRNDWRPQLFRLRMYVENLGETLNVEHAYLVEGDPAVVPTEIVFENRKPHYFTK